MVERLFPGLASLRGLVRLLCIEAGFAVAYDLWIGPAYLSGLAGELGLELGLVSVLAAVPWIGASGQILGAWLFDRSRSVRGYVLGVAAAGRALWSIPLFLAAFFALRSRWQGAPFPVRSWFAAAATCACLSSLLTSASSNAWLYWMKNLIPSAFHGRFFALRQRFTTSAFAVGSLVAAALVGWRPGGYRLGYGALGALALASGALSIWLHARVPDVPIERHPSLPPRSLRAILGRPLGDPAFLRLLAFGAGFQGAMQLASSYFPYYFTKELRIPMSSVALWGGLSNLGCFLAAAHWGRLVDRAGRAARTLWWTGHAAALAPLLYVGIGAGAVQRIAPFEYLVSGMIGSGYLLAQGKLLMRASPRGQGAAYFSVYAAASGLSGAACTFLGGQLARALLPWGGFRALWVLASLARLAALWWLLRPILLREGGAPEPRRTAPPLASAPS